MHTLNRPCPTLRAALIATALCAAGSAFGQASPYRGLWVGSASLRAVNEVSVALDENNVPIAPNPEVPTPTFDEAEIRLILHVNGAGQVSLLKDVAILNRVATSEAEPGTVASETDLALVTDPRIYASFPPQPARRIASAVFDFGDAAATAALDAMVEEAVALATDFAMDPGLDASTPALRVQARQAASALIQPELQTIADNADVAESFGQFLQYFTSGKVDLIAADTGDPVVADLFSVAETLRDQSFYADARGVDMVNAVVDAVNAAIVSERTEVAHNTASSYADVLNLYQRFISGKTFGDMILAAADEAASFAKTPGATAASVETALRGLPESTAAMFESLNAKVPMYDDTRSSLAVDQVLAAMAQAAFANAAELDSEIARVSEAAGRAELAGMVARYPLPLQTPTIDYNAFVTSAVFAASVQKTADAAATAAVNERGTNPLYSELSVESAARIAAINALRNEYALAARAQRTELPLAGAFGPGSGDPALVDSLAQPSDLGAPGLTGRIYLPASHPTNPFRHRRHPDHTLGFNIERVVRFDFDGDEGDALTPAGYGVDRVSGTYREEIFGLHKPLGPEPEANPIGLKTEGRFQLNRISFIDTLNTL